MAKIIRDKNSKLNQVINKAAEFLDNAQHEPSYASLFADKQLAQYVSVESASLTSSQVTEFNNAFVSIENLTNEVFRNEEFVQFAGDIPQHSLEAGQYLLAASSDPFGYLNAQKQSESTALESIKAGTFKPMNQEALFFGNAGSLSIDGAQTLALESFDEKELNKFLNYSIIYNVLASRQDEFNAGFFQPLTVTPDEVGYRVSLRLEQVWNGITHNPNGDVRDIQKRNLIDSLVHPEILDTNSTLVIPAYRKPAHGTTGIDTSAHFVDEKLISTVDLEGVPVKTAPLKVGMPHNLLGLSSIPALISNGLMDDKDSIDSCTRLDSITIQAGEQYVTFPTDLLYTSGFYKTPEGGMREMALDFRNNAFEASSDIKAIDGTDFAPFKAASDAGYDCRLTIRLLGNLSVDSGNVEVNTMPVRVSTVYKDHREITDLASARVQDPALDKILKGLEAIKVVGYELYTHRTNYNLRTRGIMIDSTEYTEQFVIPLRDPISIVKPLVGGDKQYPDVASLVNATRTKANNDGVTTILNLAGLLEAITSRKNYTWEGDRHSLPGIGRHFIRPVYIKEEIDLPKCVNSVQSSNRLQDIQGVITTKLNEIIGRVLKESNYIPVVEQMTGGNPGNIKAVIGTDYRLPQYIVTQGDTRLFGGKIDYEIVRTPNEKMSNKVVMTLTREAAVEGPDPFSFGTFVWTPELMVSQQLTKGPSTYVQHMVQPRYAHVINTPILVEIDIKGIEEVTKTATVLSVQQLAAPAQVKETKVTAPTEQAVGGKK